MRRGLKLSHPLISNILLFVIMSNFLKFKNIYIMEFYVANWDT
jgi:hypothetical protein